MPNAAYRQRWCKSNLDLFLYGLVDRESPGEAPSS